MTALIRVLNLLGVVLIVAGFTSGIGLVVVNTLAVAASYGGGR